VSKQEQKKKREAELFEAIKDRKTKREQMLELETGGKPFEECSSEVQSRVRTWENIFDNADRRDQEELQKLWANI
jgi:acyl-CoA reductase-like NAD-dependent aldehyde dehydrogenase